MHGISSIDVGYVISTDKVMDDGDVLAVERAQLLVIGQRRSVERTPFARHRKQ